MISQKFDTLDFVIILKFVIDNINFELIKDIIYRYNFLYTFLSIF